MVGREGPCRTRIEGWWRVGGVPVGQGVKVVGGVPVGQGKQEGGVVYCQCELESQLLLPNEEELVNNFEDVCVFACMLM